MACGHVHEETAEEKADFVMDQIRGLRNDPPHLRCFCGLKMYLLSAFKCLYCGEYYCQPCAEKHFGQTRKEWMKSSPHRAALEKALQEAEL